MTNETTRREIMKLGAALGGMAALGGLPTIARAAVLGDPAAPSGPKRVLRLAHMTDMHIQPERAAFEGVGACLRHVQSLPDKPQLIVTGGDLIMDSFDQGATRTRALWELWTKVLKDDCSLPVEHCLGNHDIWGWNKKQSRTTGEEGQWGKRWAMDVLGMTRPYRAFDKAGWRFIVLDSVFPHGEGYIGKIDDEQFAWLEATLQTTPATTPVLIVTHIPILSITSITNFKGDAVEKHEGVISEMMSDMPRLVNLFAKHRNVKACLSGHMHQLDRVEYQGVMYLCDGAVCGSWWKGRHRDCDEGYAVIDLYDDGTLAREYVKYGWKVRE